MFTNEDYETKLSTSNFSPPKHYSENGITPIQAFDKGLITKDELRGFLKGNVIKYITRYKYKNGLEDLNKAKHYIEMLIQLENGEDVNV